MDKVLTKILKNTVSYKIFDNDIENSFCHAYLLVSEDSFALDNLLTLITARVYCKTACMNCKECLKVLNNSKPDAKWLNPNQETISVKQVQELIEDSYLGSFESCEKIYIIKAFNKQSENVQNKLLKTLEEPPEGVHIFLSASSTQGILPTVLSRVKKVSLSCFPTQHIETWLRALGKEDASEHASASNGSLTIAWKLINDDEFLNLASNLVEVYNGINSSASVPLFIKNRAFEDLAKALEISEIIFQDVLYMKSERIIGVTFAHLCDEYATLADSLTLSGISNIMNELIVCEQKLNSYVLNTNIVDCFLLKIAEEKHKCKK